MRTFDFSKMYTNIKLAVLKVQMGKLFDNIFAFKQNQRRSHFVVPRGRNSTVRWTTSKTADTKHKKCFVAAKLKRWFNFLVDNIFLQFTEDHVLRQRIGIPMGTNCAVFVANMFCFTYEYDFISRIIAAGRKDLISHFRTHSDSWMTSSASRTRSLKSICIRHRPMPQALRAFTRRF